MRKAILLLAITFLFTACSKDNIIDPDIDIPDIDDTGQVLKLSVNGYVTTDKLDFEFDIVNGNGEYEITTSDEGAAKVTIDGNKVTVHLLTREVSLTVSDKSDQSVSFTLVSTAKELTPSSYSLLLPENETYVMDIEFGIGSYEIETLKGVSAKAVVTKEDDIRVSANTVGNTYFRITDKRGSTAPLNVIVPSYYDLGNENLKITAINDQRVSIALKKNGGNWSFVNVPSSPLIINPGIILKGDIEKTTDYLQFDTQNDDMKGSTTINLQDTMGNRASVTVEVK